jgi:uncharacterized membrane protein YidH (DUF202 family)
LPADQITTQDKEKIDTDPPETVHSPRQFESEKRGVIKNNYENRKRAEKIEAGLAFAISKARIDFERRRSCSVAHELYFGDWADNLSVIYAESIRLKKATMETDRPPEPDNVIFGEIQVLLAEKRTALAGLRTGIAVFALPLSVLSALIATSRYYSIEKVMPLLLPLMLLNLGLVVLGTWLVFRSIHRIRHFEHSIRELSEKYRSVAQFIE